jgi:hypothetical protein
MANEKDPEPGTRGYRVEQIRKEIGLPRRQDLAPALAEVAARIGLTEGGAWTATRISRMILGRQPMSLDDAAVVLKLAEAHGLEGKDWNWLVFGERRAAHMDPALFKPAPRSKRASKTASKTGS